MRSLVIRGMQQDGECFVGTCTRVSASAVLDKYAKRRIAWLRSRFDGGVRVKNAAIFFESPRKSADLSSNTFSAVGLWAKPALVPQERKDISMITRTAFDLDCNPVIPECGFACPKCIQEIEVVLTSMDGVGKVYMEGKGEEEKLIVEHDPAIATVDQLVESFKTLPSFYKGFFMPAVITV